jgi:hypothetical protein
MCALVENVLVCFFILFFWFVVMFYLGKTTHNHTFKAFASFIFIFFSFPLNALEWWTEFMA